MKKIEITIVTTQENADGANQVFGPVGKEFELDDKTADALIDKGAAKDIGIETKQAPVEEPTSNEE